MRPKDPGNSTCVPLHMKDPGSFLWIDPKVVNNDPRVSKMDPGQDLDIHEE